MLYIEEVPEQHNIPETDSHGLTSEGVLTLILPSNDRTDLLVRCTPCQRIFIGMDGWMKHRKVKTHREILL